VLMATLENNHLTEQSLETILLSLISSLVVIAGPDAVRAAVRKLASDDWIWPMVVEKMADQGIDAPLGGGEVGG